MDQLTQPAEYSIMLRLRCDRSAYIFARLNSIDRLACLCNSLSTGTAVALDEREEVDARRLERLWEGPARIDGKA